jgi:EAL domain-containing protein (putative c-di-GMP-specific phosphodiesterase class I)
MPTFRTLGLLPEKPVPDLAELGARLTRATGGLRVRAVSWHDADGQVLWSSSPLLGIEQREAIRDALESFAGVGARMRVDRELGDQQTAVLLRAADRAGNTLGFAMLLADSRVLQSKGRAADLPVPALQVISEFGRILLSRSGLAAPSSLRTLDVEVPQDEDCEAVAPPGAVTDAEHAALRELRLALHVQPLLALRPHSRVRRYEVLLRSQDDGGDSAAAPLAILEKAAGSGLGTVIDRRVVTPLIGWLKRRTDIVENGPCLFSVNLSPTALHDEHFLKFVEQSLADSGLPRGILAFEIPAKVLARRRTSAGRVAHALQAIGCGLVIDDFGMVESQLELLSLPGVRMVKLDPTLTHAAVDSVFAQALTAGCTQMARVLGFFTVAKRIETPEMRDHCRSLGIDFVQGYAFSGPAPLDSILPLERIEDPDAV